MNNQKNKLWTRDFTIITLGSVVSMLGNAVSGFAIGVMVLDYTDSVFLYALFMVLYMLPKIVCPLFAGPLLDAIPRKVAIYTLDFTSAGIFAALAVLLYFGWFNYPIFACLAFIIGAIDSVYSVAYESLYPNLVSSGNISKAYSISSMIYPLSAIMVPVATWVYNAAGLAPIFAFNAVTFLIAAVFETRISVHEVHADSHRLTTFSQYRRDFGDGVRYIFAEKGLLVITAYFLLQSLIGGVTGTLTLPYFKAEPSLGLYCYSLVMGASLFGRLAGGSFHYLKKLPTGAKFAIALAVYFSTTVIDAVYLFLPLAMMVLLCFINGAICVTSYNIRISATQNYIPDTTRARFNGVFQMITSAGAIIGQLIAGGVGDIFPIRGIIVTAMGINMVGVFLIMMLNGKHVKPIYNADI